mgnify:FL=1
MADYESVIKNKVLEFIKKYYLNELCKGFLFFVIITLLVFIVYAVLEYFSFFNTSTRTLLFYSYITLFSITFLRFIAYPLLKMVGFGKQLTQRQAAEIIGKHFSEIDDKLLNVLELEQQLESSEYKSHELLLAAIDTKTEKIKPFSFVKAIPFKKNIKYLKWALIPVFMMVMIFSIKSEVFTESTHRIVNYNKEYSRPAPYSIEIEHAKLSVFQNDDFTLNAKIVGEEVPENIFIKIGKRTYKCTKIDKSHFLYTFKNLQKDTEFQLFTEEVAAPSVTLKVLPKPIMISYVLQLNYPSYLNKNSEVIENNGDATIPEGTQIEWRFYTKNTEELSFIINDKINVIDSESDIYKYSVRVLESFDYAVVNKNQYISNADTLNYSISVIKDAYPEILVENQRDSLFADRVYFKGSVKDDYGFNDLNFVYSKFSEDGQLIQQNIKIPIEIEKQSTLQNFYFYFDAALLKLEPGNKIDYYFEIRDNDGVNGSKSAKSKTETFKIKTLEEIEKEVDQMNSQTKKEMSEMMDESANLMKEIENFSKQLLQKENISWQDKQKMENLIQKFNELKQQLEQIKESQQNKQNIEEQYKSNPEEILKKQQELQKRYDEILSDEIKEMLEKIQQMMQDANKDKMQDAIQKMKSSSEDLNKSLDQQLQLFKYLEYEQKFNEVLDKLRNLSQEQKNQSLQTPKKEISKDNLQQEQQKINDEFKNIIQDIKDLQNLNNQLEEPNQMKNTQEMEQNIQKMLNQAQDALSKNQRGKAEQNQKSAADEMEKMADEMEQQQNENELEEITEDIEMLRQIMDNLVKVSFKQESNMQNYSKTNSRSSSLNDFIKEQKNIQDLMKLIDDSLNTLARRQVEIQSFVQKESGKIKDYHELVMKQMIDRRNTQAVGNQQFALTSMNNLALMLAESMKNMKQKQQECKGKCKKSGGGSCSKPGNSQKQSKAKTARELQQQLNRQMEALKRSMEQGGKQQGQTQQGQSMSEQFAKMAAQQEAIRRMMQEMQNENRSQNGVGDKSLDQLIREMEATEKDLVNRVITQQTINRQKNIETRMLQSEKAQQEREKEEKRESTEGREKINPTPPKEWNFDKEKMQQLEMLKTIPPSLHYYYKEKANQYFYNIE